MPDVLRAILPLRTVLPGIGPVAIAALQYCVEAGKDGEFLAVVRPIEEAEPTMTELSAEDCQRSLRQVRDAAVLEAPEGEPWAAALRLRSRFSPWEVRLEAATADAGRLAANAVETLPAITTKLLTAIPTARIQTAAVRLNAQRQLPRMNFAIHAVGNALTLVGAEGDGEPPPGVAADLRQRMAAGPAHTTLVLRMPYEFLSEWAAAEVKQGVNVADNGSSFVFSDPQVIGSPRKLRLQVLAQESKSGARYQLVYEWTGDDSLRLTTISVTSIPRTCTGSPLEQAGCAIKNNLAAGIGAAFQTRMRDRLAGRRMRPLRSGSPSDFTVQGKPLRLDAETLRVEAGSDALYIYALAWLVNQ